MAKLNNLPLEAPITKVMTLLNNAMAESTNPEVSMQIDKVNMHLILLFPTMLNSPLTVKFSLQAIETLKNTELYAPVMREDIRAVHDPVTSDLIGALISVITLLSHHKFYLSKKYQISKLITKSNSLTVDGKDFYRQIFVN